MAGRELGVLAQEIEAVFPDAVVSDAGGLKQVDYAGLVAVLIEAVKELDARVRNLETERISRRQDVRDDRR